MTTSNSKLTSANANLSQAIVDVYRTFSRNPMPARLDASPVEDVDEIAKSLSSAPLGQLSADAIGTYAAGAMTTIGDVEDYRHFLPRIIHLASFGNHGQPGLDPQIIALKVAYGGWRSWPADEQQAIEQVYDRAWARARLLHPDEAEAEDWLCGNALIGNRLDDGLNDWIANPTADSMVQLVHFLNGADSVAGAFAFWQDVSSDIRHQIVDWLLSEAVETSLINAVSEVDEGDLWRFDGLEAGISQLKHMSWRE